MTSTTRAPDPRHRKRRNGAPHGPTILHECSTPNCFNPVAAPSDLRRVVCAECVQRVLLGCTVLVRRTA